MKENNTIGNVRTEKNEEKITELEQENELLLLQLHQVQEELEHYFLLSQSLQENQNSHARAKHGLFISANEFPQTENWYEVEQDEHGSWRWTGPGSTAAIHVPCNRDKNQLVIIHYKAVLKKKQIKNMSLSIDGNQVSFKIFQKTNPGFIITSLPKSTDRTHGMNLTITIPDILKPSDIDKNSPDHRPVGIAIIGISCVPAYPHVKLGPQSTLLKSVTLKALLTKNKLSLSQFPITHFDGIAYLTKYPDVAKAVEKGSISSALVHYIKFGFSHNYYCPIASDHPPTEGDIYDLRNNNAENQEIIKLKNRLNQVISEKEHYRNQLHICQDEKKHLQQDIDRYGNDLHSTQKHLENLQTICDKQTELANERKKQISELQEKLAYYKQKLQKKQEQIEKHKEITEENELLLLQLHQVQEELEEIFIAKTNQTELVEELEKRITKLKTELDQYQQDLKQREHQLEDLTTACDNQTKLAEQRKTDIDSLQAQIENYATLLKEKQAQVDELKANNDSLNSSVQQKNQKIQELESLIEHINDNVQEKQAYIDKLMRESSESANLLNDTQKKLEQIQKELKEKSERLADTESALAESEHRQHLLDEEIVKAEAQIHLISDILIREKAF